MRVVGRYPFSGGDEVINKKYKHLLDEIYEIISAIDANKHKTKKSKEKTMPGKVLYSPGSLNKAFKNEFHSRNWQVGTRVKCKYSTEYYTENYQPKKMMGVPFRAMDFIKERLGIELQFGKYAFMVYNVCAKMTIFSNLGLIDVGLEIVPIKEFANQMSSGVSYFEQFVWDLQTRGVSNIDIPVLILGIDA